MKIKDLISALPEYDSLPKKMKAQGKDWESISNQEVLGLAQDSRQVKQGCVYVAITGFAQDGHKFLPDVVEKNPVALIVEQEKSVPASYQGLVVRVPSARGALDLLSARYYGDPSRKLLVFGVTGTNGKTSCAYIFEHILNKNRIATGVIGTIDHHLGEQVWPTKNTTPGALELQERLSQMLALGGKAVAMEVTSHALAQERVSSVQFNCVLFTNLSHDHLDYHGTIQNYFHAKEKLFKDLLWKSQKIPVTAVVNIDDSWAQKLRVASNAHILTFGKSNSADFRWSSQGGDFSSTDVEIVTALGDHKATLPLCGEHSISNAVGVVAACASLGLPVAVSLQALKSFPGVPGRLQPVPNSRGLNIFIDYAHTPDALERVLKTLQQIRSAKNLKGRIFVVFGCGGDRDRTKRPVMGKLAAELADFVILTSDNPRSEEPLLILREIANGIDAKHRSKITEEPARPTAIQLAISTAKSNDVVLIAGKGHEDYQEIQGKRIHMSDFEMAKEACR